MRNSTGSVPKWPGWETIRMIGRGNYGAVYEIQRNNFGMVEKAALKRIAIPQEEGDLEEYYNNGYDEDSLTEVFQSHLESVVAEYSLMRKMNGCVNIVNCDDILYEKQEDGIGWNILIRMELLTPITKALTDAVTEEMVCKVARDMCTALTHCKEFGIVHRDIKPQNIFVSRFGDYKLGDFGIAKTVEKTMGGTKIGTYNYMAPEVYMNQPYGAAVDIYSLGLVLYWMLNEKRMPFMPLPPEKLRAGMDEQSRMRRLSGEPLPPPAHGSEKLKRIVLKACAFDPKERYQSAAEMLADLNAGEAAAIPEPPKPPVEYHPAPVEVSMPEPQVEPEDAGDKTSYLWAKEQTEKASDRTVLITPEKKTPEAPKKAQNPAVEKMEESARKDSRKTIGGMKALGLFSVIAALIAGTLFWGYFNIHFWTEATCTEGSVCKLCGKRHTVALGHKWTEATCTEGSVCKLCGEQQTAALGHGYENGICSVCGDLQLKILDQPDNVIAERGDYIVFHVEAVGEGICYQWYEKDNNGIVECGDKKDTYSFYNNYDSGKRFFCIITDKYGNSVQTNTVIIMKKR